MKSVLTVEKVTEQLRAQRGNQAAVARHFGVTRSAVCHFIKAHDSLEAITVECRESMKDVAENALYKAVEAGEAWAVCFYLKCQAKDRGYFEKSEVDHTGNVTVHVKRVVVDAASRSRIGSNGTAPSGSRGLLPES